MPLYLRRMGSGETYNLSPDKDKILIGRGLQCDIRFSSLYISRQHCLIIRSTSDGPLVIKNIRDNNCTYVNELKLQSPDVCAELQVGSRIGLGVPLACATDDGMRNSSYVFLQLEGSQHSLEQSEAKATEDNGVVEVEAPSQPGEPLPVAIFTEAAFVQGGVGTCLTSAHSNQEQRVPTEGLRPHIISSSDDLNSELVPRSISTSDMSLSVQSDMSWTTSTSSTSHARNWKGKHEPSSVISEEVLNHTRQPNANANDCYIVKQESVTNENSVAPMQTLPTNHRQGCTNEDESVKALVGNGGEQKDEASVSTIVVSKPTSFHSISSPPSQSGLLTIKDKESISLMSIDLTQADSDSSSSTSCNKDSSKKEQLTKIKANNLISLASPDVQIISSPEKSPPWKSEEVSGKRKRLFFDEPSSLTSEADEDQCISLKKKVKSSSLSHGDKDIIVTGETLLSRTNQTENEIGQCSSTSNITETLTDIDRELLIQIIDSDSSSELQIKGQHSDETGQKEPSGDSDSDSESLFCFKKAKLNLSKSSSNKPSKNCDTESKEIECMQASKQNSKECCNSLKVDDSDDDSLFFNRKSDGSMVSVNSNSDSEPLMPKKKRGHLPVLICSSDDESDKDSLVVEEKTQAKKSVESTDVFSVFKVHPQKCAVQLKKLPSYVVKSSTVDIRENSFSKYCPSSSNKNKSKITGDEVDVDGSKKSRYKHSEKSKTDSDSSLSDKDKEEVINKLSTTKQQKHDKMQDECVSEHSYRKVARNTSREGEMKGTSIQVPPQSECTSLAHSTSSSSVDSEQRSRVTEASKIFNEPSKNTAEAASEIKVKTEPGVLCKENRSSTESDDENEVTFNYSQVGEEIWISSDEDETHASGNASSSLDEELDFLFVEEDEYVEENERKAAIVGLCNSSEKIPPEEGVSKMEDHGSKNDNDHDDDQWFPVLSQSFLESSDEDDNKDDECNKDSKDDSPNAVESEPLPGPSGMSVPVPESEENEVDEWWPVLSQGFFDDTEPEEGDDDKVLVSNNSELETGSGGEISKFDGQSDLKSVIKKLKKTNPRRSQLTEAKIPPRISRGRKKQKESDQGEGSIFYKASDTSPTSKEKHVERRKKQTHSVPKKARPVHKIGKKNSSPDLRKILTSKYDLESYKHTLECQTKEKHHLVSKNEGKANKSSSRPPPCKSVNKAVVHPKATENISIQKKTKAVDPTSQNKPHSKVAAKVTTKSRFEKLIDYDITAKPAKPAVASKRKSFKIPKTSGAPADVSSMHAAVQGYSSILDKNKSSKASGNSGESVLSKTTEPQPGSTSEKIHTEKQTLHSSSSAMKNDTSGSTDEISSCLERVKLKSKPKNVHFPQREEDLVKVFLISPCKKGEKTGLPKVRARETLPKELQLHRQNVPPYFMELFVHHVCHWNYDWLDCYDTAQEKYRAGVLKSIPAPPPVVNNTNYPTLILYSSYSDYKETHSSLFYLELWEKIYRDWLLSRHKNINLQALIEFVKPAFIRTHSGVLKFWAVKLMVAVPQTQNMNYQDFKQGTLISLKVRKEAKKSVIFGYIDYMIVNNRHMPVAPQTQSLGSISHSFSLGVRVTKETIQTIKPGTVVTITSLSYIRPSSRIWESLFKLPLSPLCNDILSPSLSAFSCNKETKYIVQNLPLNEMQEKAVTTVSSKCMYDSHIPKISLIHGPPGTGKTSTIVALVAQMVRMGRSLGQGGIPHCRLLICAPSNAAVDELTLRLIRLRDTGLSLRVVRVGFKVSDHPLVRNCTLDQFVSKQIRMEISTPRCESAKQEWQRRKILVEQIAEELEAARKEGKHNDVRQLEIRLNEMARAKAEFEKSFVSEPSNRERYELQQKWQKEFLLKAEVVTTTLNSCVSGVMAEVLSKHLYHFTCCIVDEAGQCQETETLLPLLLGIRKLVLVGDHHQLPATVLSQLALSKNLKQSLFERMHHRLVLELHREDLVHTLNIQYRMHPAIVEWPAHHFYMNKLITSPELESQASIHLSPYMIFDLKSSQEQRTKNQEMYNPAEASLVYLLLEVLQPHLGHKTVGIITPYQRQRIHLEEKLAKFKGIINLSINTIDGFQGQERDVIILSFVRANNSASIGFLSHRQRLNVALTRARKVCYIIASLSSLEGNKEWNSLIRNGRMRGLVCPVGSTQENDKNFFGSVIEAMQ